MRLILVPALLAALMTTVSACTTMATAAPPAPQAAARVYTAQEEEILQVVDRMLLAVGNHDTVALEDLLITEGVSWFQHITPEEAAAVEPFHNEDLMSPETDADPFIERYWNPTIQIRGGLAHVWTNYELRDDGKQVHCGIDAFDLVYLDGDWRVASILSTMEPKACDATMPASPASMRPRDGWKETPNQ
ncbi:MAG: hypothetical protein ABMA14_06070 [Hyphomonadaceae bacterium]